MSDNDGATKAAEIVAAVDLGSNSFHMIVAELRHGQLAVIDRIRETVRLAEGLSNKNKLSPDARARALDCLSRFGQRLRDVKEGNVRAAGTETIRRVSEKSGFLREAEQLLGHPIDVISGLEEARLVYTGVGSSVPPTDGLRLVTDIGGGSTEIILGQAEKTRAVESLHIGCVSMTERFFPDGHISAHGFAEARVAAQLELRPVKAFFRKSAELQAIGTSGTIRATLAVAQQLGLAETGLTLPVIESLIDIVLQHESVDQLQIKGLSERRSQVWPGGLAILAELISALRIEEMGVSDGALREGLLYDLLGRLQHEDARERTVTSMASQYHVDVDQAERVARTAKEIWSQCRIDWEIDKPLAGQMLDWSARLHEIGLGISHDGYQRHGAYIEEQADMPGFPQAEQRFLSILIRLHRHRIDASRFDVLPRAWRTTAIRLLIILRLAVLLNRGRASTHLVGYGVAVEDGAIHLSFDENWLAANPLSVADLKREAHYLEQIQIQLAIN